MSSSSLSGLGTAFSDSASIGGKGFGGTGTIWKPGGGTKCSNRSLRTQIRNPFGIGADITAGWLSMSRYSGATTILKDGRMQSEEEVKKLVHVHIPPLCDSTSLAYGSDQSEASRADVEGVSGFSVGIYIGEKNNATINIYCIVFRMRPVRCSTPVRNSQERSMDRNFEDLSAILHDHEVHADAPASNSNLLQVHIECLLMVVLYWIYFSG